jgi:undecaprenyl-diphosphatase
MTWWQALLLGLVEGVTEYLPVSSTGHLILTAWLLGMADDPDRWSAAFTFNVTIQAGAIAAVVLLYHERLRSMVAGVLGQDAAGRRLATNVVVATLPAAVLGTLFGDLIEERLNGPWPVVVALFLGALLMLAVAWHQKGRREEGVGLEDLGTLHAFWIGCGQCLAMWPGTSRSMVTIVVALVVGLRAVAAAEFSFLLGLATLSGATVFKLAGGGAAMLAELGVGSFVIGIVAATISAAVAVKWFVAFLHRYGLAPFAWYRLAVAFALAGAILSGWLTVPRG